MSQQGHSFLQQSDRSCVTNYSEFSGILDNVKSFSCSHVCRLAGVWLIQAGFGSAGV